MGKRSVVLVRLVVIGPDLPARRDRVGQSIAVCFCGRPLPRWELVEGRESKLVRRCPCCGWAPRRQRQLERLLAAADHALGPRSERRR